MAIAVRKSAVLAKCPCGSYPEVQFENQQRSQGAMEDIYYVLCPCGLRGKSFSDYNYSIKVAIQLACEFWNSLFKVNGRVVKLVDTQA